jgi:SAM-dependent methyltransferase
MRKPRPRARPGARRRRAAPPPDRHVLYERAVQNAPYELDFVERLLRREGLDARLLREDFSGTALLSAEWVRRGADREAVAVDRDASVHAWARAHRLPSLGEAAARLRLVTADVRDPNPAPRGGGYDLVLALNFSWQVFREPSELGAYLAGARAALAPGGLLVLDAFGGWDAQRPLVERRRIRGGAVYEWEQESFDPITHRIRCAIHFALPGRRRLDRAFTYDWRLWSLPEVTALMAAAGLEASTVHWDVAKRRTETRYRPRTSAENQAGWLAYVVGRRPRT